MGKTQYNRIAMSKIPWFAAWALAGLVVGTASTRAGATAEDGVALAVVYDTSGSMNDPVRDGAGQPTPKHIIAQRAMQSVVKRLQGFTAGGAAGSPRRLDAGLYVFSDGKVREFTKLAPFEAKTATAWTRELPRPSGGTPLGNALQTAGEALLRSPLSAQARAGGHRRPEHGRSRSGAVAAGPQADGGEEASLSVHFIAFDVDARLFEPLKKQGVTVVGAADERQLNTQLEFILEKRILLEDEEPPRKN